MADAAEPADISVDGNVVGWVGKNEIGTLALHQAIECIRFPRIPAQQAVTIEQPQVCNPGHRHRGLGDGRDRVVSPVVGIGRRLSGFIEQHIDLGQGEAGDLDVEFQIDQRLQLDCQHLAVPAGIEGQLVVGQHIGPALGRIEVGQAQRRNTLHAQQLCGFHPAVAGDDLVIIADQDRIGEAEALNAVGDLPDLILGMEAGVFRERPQTCDGHRLHGNRGRGGSAAAVILFQGHLTTSWLFNGLNVHDNASTAMRRQRLRAAKRSAAFPPNRNVRLPLMILPLIIDIEGRWFYRGGCGE
jgi:hypothetical protein